MKGFTNNKNLIAFGLALFVVIALWLAVPLTAFVVNDILDVLLISNLDTKTTDITVIVPFEKTSPEVINTITGQLIHFETVEDIPGRYSLYPGRSVYASHCYNDDWEINMTGDGIIYDYGYDYYGYSYGYGYGYGYEVTGDFYCEFTFTELPDGIYGGVLTYIDDTVIGAANFGEGGNMVIVLKSITGDEIDNETINVTEDFEFELIDPETGEIVMWFSIPNGTEIYNELGYPTTFISLLGIPDDFIDAEDLLSGGAIGSMFVFAPSGTYFDPAIEVCLQYNATNSPLWGIWDTNEEINEQLQEWDDDGLLYFLLCNDTGDDCEEIEIDLNTDEGTMCVELEHFSTGVPMKDSESSPSVTPGYVSMGGARPVTQPTPEEDIEEEETEDETTTDDETPVPPKPKDEDKPIDTPAPYISPAQEEQDSKEEKGDSTIIIGVAILLLAGIIYWWMTAKAGKKGLFKHK